MMTGIRIFFDSFLTKTIVLSIAILWSFMAIFQGCPFTDTFFYLNGFASGVPFRFFEGTQILTLMVLRIFGEKIFVLRVVEWLIYATSFILAYIWFLPKPMRGRMVYVLAATFIFQSAFSLNYTNADSTSLLVSVCFMKLLQMWYEDRGRKIAVSLSLIIIIVVGMLMRFTNVVIIPISMAFVFFKSVVGKDGLWKQYLILCVISAASYLAALTSIHVCWGGQLVHPQVVATICGSQHTISSLIYYYIQGGKIFIQYLPFCLILLIVCCKCFDNKAIDLGLKSFAVIYLYFYLKYHVGLSVACENLSIFISSFCCSMIILSLLKTRDWSGWNTDLLILTGLMAMVNPAGSDSAFLKLVWMLIAMLPFTVWQFLSLFPSERNRIFTAIVLMILAVYAMWQFYEKPMPCVPAVSELKYEIPDKRLKHLKVSEDRYKLYEYVSEDLSLLDTRNVIFYGMQGHGLYYLFNVKNKLHSDFFMYGDDVYNATSISECIRREKPVIFDLSIAKDRQTIVEDSILTNGYALTKVTDCYKVYQPVE